VSLTLAFDALKKAHLDAYERAFVFGCLQAHDRDERLSFMTSAKTRAVWLLVWKYRQQIDSGIGLRAPWEVPAQVRERIVPALWLNCFSILANCDLRKRTAAHRMIYGKQSS
jgi:hypothetical protein